MKGDFTMNQLIFYEKGTVAGRCRCLRQGFMRRSRLITGIGGLGIYNSEDVDNRRIYET